MKNKTIASNTDVIAVVSEAYAQMEGFEGLYQRLERRMHAQRRSESTKNNYARPLAPIAQGFCPHPALRNIKPHRKVKINNIDP